MSTLLALAIVTATAPRLGSMEVPTKVEESRIAVARYADCVVARNGATVEEMLARPYDDRVEKAARVLYDPTCPLATERAAFPVSVMRDFSLSLRGVFYAALVRRDRAKLQDGVSFPERNAFPIGRNWPGSPASNYLEYMGMGLCVLKSEPIHAKSLTMSSIDSIEEEAHYAAMEKSLRKCGFAKSRHGVERGVLSEIIYRSNFDKLMVSAGKAAE